MSVQLFAHNRQAYDAVTAMLGRTSKAAVIHPTGTGKSYIAFKWIEEHAGERFVWISPSEYIYHTQIENVTRTAPDFPVKNITFLTYARLMMMTDGEIAVLAPFGIILDEFHRCGAKCWGGGVARLLSAYPGTQLLGLSATKIRYLDGQRDMAEELFEGCVASEMALGEAVVRGILPAPTYVTTIYQIQRELEGLQKRIDAVGPAALRRDNQWRMDALRLAVESAEGLPSVFARHMTDKVGKYLVFCSGQAHMKRVLSHAKEWFGSVDPEMHVYSAYSADPETSRAYKAFVKDDSDHLKLLFSINMLNEGVHVRGVSGVILFRQTESPIIYKQQIGRALTAGENYTPLILDVVNNFEGLCSIAGLQGEMQEAIYRLNANGEGDRIITERFEVIEQVHDCRVLFEQLQASLSSSWNHYFSEASIYYAEHGDLNIPKRYTTPAGLSLGEWLTTQRRVRAGQIPGNLTEQQIARLDSIGMEWGNRNDAAWERGLEEARKFREQFGNLQVPAKYKTKDDYPLGKWINNARKRRNDGKLTEERIRQLNQLGMAWKVFDVRWEQGYALAAVYAQEYGNLDVPRDYKTADGKTLGRWIQNQELAYEQKKLSADQIKRLETIGMQWGSRYDRQWNEVYQAAKRYFEANGNLDVPVAYVSPEGYALGKWVRRQQYAYRKPEKSNAILSQERIELLDAIGMQWEKPDPWQHRYELAQEYKRCHGNLDISAKYKTADGIWLSRWVYNQKRLLQSGSEKLSEEQKKKLKELLGYYVKISA